MISSRFMKKEVLYKPNHIRNFCHALQHMDIVKLEWTDHHITNRDAIVLFNKLCNYWRNQRCYHTDQ